MTKGQILPLSNFCQHIQNTIVTNPVQNIVEIGTWKGLGSTKCIIDAIINNKLTCSFTSIESNIEFYNEAIINLSDYRQYVNLIYGRLIEPEEVLTDISANNIEFNQDWLDIDIQCMRQNSNILNVLPDHIDFLLLDGGEYSTYLEWQKLKDRTNIVALDNTSSVKCNRIRQALLSDSNYHMLVDSSERNGFSIFQKIIP